MTDGVLTDLTDGLLTITLNRPSTLNSLDGATAWALTNAVRSARGDDVRSLLITGSERAFCSGADLSAVTADSSDSQTGTTLDAVNELQRTIQNLNIPTVAAVSGPAAGVGCSIALMCDYVVMSEKSYFMLAFTGIGLMPDGGATALVAASAGRHRALRMALTAEKVQAATALDWGLASEVVPTADWAERARTVASGFASGATRAVGATRLAINKATLTQLDAALDREAVGQAGLLVSDDFREGGQAFMEKRKPVFTGK